MRLRGLPLMVAALLAVPVGIAGAGPTAAAADEQPPTLDESIAEFMDVRSRAGDRLLQPAGVQRSRQADNVAAPTVERIGGVNRYATAAELSLRADDVYFGLSGEHSPFVFLATGANYPDALAAGAVQAPILLTARDSIPLETLEAIKEIDPDHVIIVGGAGAVSAQVEETLEASVSAAVERIEGPDRFSTAAAVSQRYSDPGGIVYLATGLNYPDALAAGPVAGADNAPILLTAKDSLPPATAAELDRLDPQLVVVVGGEGAVSEAVLNEAAQYAASGAERRSGPDRYATAVELGLPVFDPALVASPAPVAWEVILATGTGFADALAAGPAAYWGRGLVLLTRPTCSPAVVQDRVEQLRPLYLTIAGGPAAIADGSWEVTC